MHISRKLIVTAGSQDGSTTYNFPVYEFDNGAILVPSDRFHDRFSDSRDAIKVKSPDVVRSIEDTDERYEWTTEQLIEIIEECEIDYGGVSAKIRSLVNF